MVYELIGYNTDCRYRDDIRYRRYTTSKKEAEKFGKIPKLQFSDSGHGIVFAAREHSGKRQSTVTTLADYVRKYMTMTSITVGELEYLKGEIERLRKRRALLREELEKKGRIEHELECVRPLMLAAMRVFEAEKEYAPIRGDSVVPISERDAAAGKLMRAEAELSRVAAKYGEGFGK